MIDIPGKYDSLQSVKQASSGLRRLVSWFLAWAP